MRKDELSNSKLTENNRDVALQKKTRLYDDLETRKRNIKQLLVNFEEKGLDNDADQYEEER